MGRSVLRKSADRARPVTIVCLGDSNTFRSAQPSQFWSWPFPFQRIAGQVRVVNSGFSGADSTEILAQFSTLAVPYEPDWVVCMVGTVEVQAATTTDPNERNLLTNLAAIYAAAKNLGARTIGMTILPCGSAGAWDSNTEAQRTAANTWILNTATLDKRVNHEPTIADATVPTQPVITAAFNNGDGTHLNQAGHAQVAANVEAQAFSSRLVPPVISSRGRLRRARA